MSAYPPHWEADVVLADGGTVHLRPIVAEDADELVRFHAGLSADTVRFRFFTAHPRLSPKELEHFTRVDYASRVAMVALLRGELIAVGRYDSAPGTDIAEVAFVVADAHQGRGLGSVLLEHLAAIAGERGIRRFEAEVLAENVRMARVFRDAGYTATRHFEQDVVQLTFPIEPTAASMAVMASREHRSEARSIRRLLKPRSVAVFGAGRDPAGPGALVLVNLLRSGFQGAVYPLDPDAASVAGVHAYPTVEAVPDDVDIAVVAAPVPAMDGIVAQCARKGVHGLIVLSGGYSECGPAGAAAERALVATARADGMRVIGPNSAGVMTTAPDVRLNATLSPVFPPAGRAGFFSQSGALGVAILDSVRLRGLGLSSFVSAGNRADVSGNDLLQYWEDDADTDVVLLYLESFGNPRKFARLARRLGRTKPIVAVTSGGPVAARLGSAGVGRHAVDALFRQAGVIRVDTLSQLFDVAALLTSQPLPAGPRVAVVGNSAALGRLATDACAGGGLSVGEFSAGTRETLRAALGPEVAMVNPLVLPARGGATLLRRVLDTVLADPGVDAAVTTFLPPVGTSSTEAAQASSAASAAADKPVLSTSLTFSAAGAEEAVPAGSVPLYPSPEEAVAALARTVAYAQWRRRPEGVVPVIEGIEPDAGRALVQRELVTRQPGAVPAPATDGGVTLSPDAVTGLLAAFGVRVWPGVVVRTVEAAESGAAELGYPVALKATAEHLRHRPELGTVRLDIAAEDELRAAYQAMSARLGAGAGLTVQAMAPAGEATVIRVDEDPSFGALVSFGLGGVATDLLGDRAFRIVPLTEDDAADLVRSVRAAPLLTGYRGSEPVDMAALEQLVLRVAALADALPEVAQLELNPVIASRTGVSVLGAGGRVRPVAARPDTGPRRLG